MVATTVINGLAVELEVELKPNQEPQKKKQRSLGSDDSPDPNYDVENNIDQLYDSISVASKRTQPR